MRWLASSPIACWPISACPNLKHFAGKAEASITYRRTEKSHPSSGTLTDRGPDFSVETSKGAGRYPRDMSGREEKRHPCPEKFSDFVPRNTSRSLRREPE